MQSPSIDRIEILAYLLATLMKGEADGKAIRLINQELLIRDRTSVVEALLEILVNQRDLSCAREILCHVCLERIERLPLRLWMAEMTKEPEDAERVRHAARELSSMYAETAAIAIVSLFPTTRDRTDLQEAWKMTRFAGFDSATKVWIALRRAFFSRNDDWFREVVHLINEIKDAQERGEALQDLAATLEVHPDGIPLAVSLLMNERCQSLRSQLEEAFCRLLPKT